MNSPAASQKKSPQSKSATGLIEGLQPSLGNALSSLSVKLDHELARYRYAKRGTAQPATPQFRSRQKPLSLVNPPTQSARSQKATRKAVTPPPPPNPRLQKKTVTPPPPPPNPRLQQEAPAAYSAGDEARLEGSAIAPSAVPSQPTSEVAALRSALVVQPEPPEEEEYLASSEALLESFDNPYAGQAPETITQPPEPNWVKQLNTPLGLGALLLLLVTSAGFGFVLVNPVAVRHLVDQTPLAHLWPNPETAEVIEEATPASENSENTDLVGTPGESPLNPLSPDLSRQEFAELDFNSLSTLPSAAAQARIRATTPESGDESEAVNARQGNPTVIDRSQATAPTPGGPSTNNVPNPAIPNTNVIPRPTTAPAPANIAPPVEAAPPASQPAAAPVAEPAVPVPTAAPAVPAQPAAVVESAPEAPPLQSDPPAVVSGSAESVPANLYYVVTDYTGDPSLDSAREAVDEAYVRNFEAGARIQMGAFGSEEAATSLIENLQDQGIEAQIYTP